MLVFIRISISAKTVILIEPIFASPDFSGMEILLPIIGAIMPIFLFCAFMGQQIVAGVLQGLFLIGSFTLALRYSLRLSAGWQAVILIASYFAVNLTFTIIWFVTIPFRVSLGLLF